MRNSIVGLGEICREMIQYYFIFTPYFVLCGPGSSVGSDWLRAGRSGIESRCGRNFPHFSRPALRPTQPPVHWIPGRSRGKERPGRDADLSSPSSAAVKKE